MSNYKVTISSTINKCPFNPKKKAKDCNSCKALMDPCKGIGHEQLISSANISEEKMKQILSILKNK